MAAAMKSDDDTAGAPAADDGVAAFRAETARYGVAYAVMRDGFTGKGVDRAVLASKIVIAAIALYAVVSAVLTGVGG